MRRQGDQAGNGAAGVSSTLLMVDACCGCLAGLPASPWQAVLLPSLERQQTIGVSAAWQAAVVMVQQSCTAAALTAVDGLLTAIVNLISGRLLAQEAATDVA